MEFQFNSIQNNDMQVGGEGIVNILLNLVFRKNKLLKYLDPKSTFPCFFIWGMDYSYYSFKMSKQQ